MTRRHAEFYRELSRELGVSLRGPDQARWVERLERGTGAGDIDNVRAALRWYIDHGELDHVDRIVWSLWLLGWVSGRLEECHRWAREALSAPGALARGGRARLLTVAGLFEMWKGEYAASMSALTEAVTIARGLRDDDVLANSLLGLGLASAFVEGMQTARSHAEEAHALFRAHGDRWGQATSCSALTWFLVAEDDFDADADAFEEALARSWATTSTGP